jgi:hypothetical protein
MFHRPNAAALNAQYERQGALVAYWQGRLGLQEDRTRHVLLLPEPLAAAVSHDVDAPIITWEAVANQFDTVADPYWVGVLRNALARYSRLAAKDSAWGQNKQMLLTGLEIVTAYQQSDPNVAWIGRRGGLTAHEMISDAATGAWRTHSYEVRDSRPDGTGLNWFPVAEFVAYVLAARATNKGEAARPL